MSRRRSTCPGVPIFITHELGESGTVPADCIEISAYGADSDAHVLSMIGSAPGPD